MQFCEVCGSMMRSNGERMVCTDADCNTETEPDQELAEAFISTHAQHNVEVIETTEGDAFEGKPTAEVYCESCGHDRAWYTIKQTASADEPPTRFFKCMDCGYRWRDYN